MYITLLILALAVLVYLIARLLKHRPLTPLFPQEINFGKRRVTFSKCLELLSQSEAKVLIETGTSRAGLSGAKPDGAATIVFGKWAHGNNAFLHSVDISEDSVAGAQNEVEAQNLTDCVKVHTSDSLDFLKKFTEKVDFLYLDSYDYSDDVKVQKLSQQHHLDEFQAVEDRLHENTIVLIDDCRLPNGGKGKQVVEYMLQNDWKILINAYQILLVHNKSDYL